MKAIPLYSSIVLILTSMILATAGYLDLGMTSTVYAAPAYQEGEQPAHTAAGAKGEFRPVLSGIHRSFSPRAESWFTITLSSDVRPTVRHETGFVRAGNLFYLIGGRDRDPVDVYDPVARSWTPRQQIPTEMHHFQAVELDGLIYIIGAFEGNCCDESPRPIVHIYDPYDDQWIEGPEIPESRRRGSAGAVVYEGKFYIVSGLTVGHQSGWVTWVDEYDPATNSWRQLSDAPRSRDHFHAGIVGDKIVAAGGRNSGRDGIFNYTIGEVDVYDIATNTWTTGPNDIPTQRAGTTAAALGNEVFIIGGESGRSEAYVETEAYNVGTQIWRTVGGLNRARHGTQAIVANNAIYVASGSGARGGGPELDSIEAYNYSEPPPSPGDALVESRLAAANSTVNFGALPVDDEETKDIVLTNTDGNQAIVLTNIQLSGDGAFSYTFPLQLPVVIAPGATATIAVRFNPDAERQFNASLTVQHSGADGETSISIAGSGGSELNQPPFVDTSIEDRTVDEDSGSFSIDLSQTFADPDQSAATLTYSVTTPAFPSILLATTSGSTLLIATIPNAHGTIPITVNATDDEGLSSTEAFSVTIRPVNDGPSIDSNPAYDMAEGEMLPIPIIGRDIDGDLLTFEVKVQPNMDIASFMTTTQNQGLLNFEPGYSDAGIHTVTVTATDTGLLTATDQFTITVTDRDRTPSISPIQVREINAGEVGTQLVTSSDLDGDPVVISAVGLPDFVESGETTLLEDGLYGVTFDLAPKEGDEGTYVATIRAEDPAGNFSETQFTIVVASSSIPNRPPTISEMDDVTVRIGLQFTRAFAVADPDTDDLLTLAVTDMPPGMTIDDDDLNDGGTINISLDGSTPAGRYPITATVSDAEGLTASESFVLTIEEAEAMLPPQPVNGVSMPEVEVGEVISLTVRFVDPNADAIVLASILLPAGASFTDQGDGEGLITWQPDAESVGQHVAIISATDSTGLSTQRQYQILVKAPPPEESTYITYLPLQ